AAGRSVKVEETNELGPGVAETVDRARRGRDEGARTGDARLVPDPELDRPGEDVEGGDGNAVRVRFDAFELRLEGHVERGEVRQVGEDPVHARLVLERLGVVGPGEDSVRERAASVCGRVVLVEAGVVAPAELVPEAQRRRVEVEEDDSRVAGVAEGVDDVR